MLEIMLKQNVTYSRARYGFFDGGITGIGSAIGSVIGGIANNKAQKSANKANIQMNRETNQMNYRIMQEQNAFNEKMWNATNAYNTPVNQRLRYEAAGINPYFAMSNISNGNPSSSLQSAGATMQSAQVQPVNYDWISQMFPQALSAIKTKAETSNIDSDTKLKDIDAQYSGAMYLAKLAGMYSERLNKNADTKSKNLANKMFEDTYDTLKRQTENREIQQNLEIRKQYLENNSIQWDNLIKEFNFKNILPQQLQNMKAQYDDILADISLKVAQKELTKEQAKTEGTKRVAMMIEAYAAQETAHAATENAKTNKAVGNATINNLNASAGKTKSETWLNRQQFNYVEKTVGLQLEMLENNVVISGYNAKQAGYGWDMRNWREARGWLPNTSLSGSVSLK